MTNVIGLGQLRSHTCGYLDQVAAGETLGIVRRGKLVGWIRSTADVCEIRSVANTNSQTDLLPVHICELRNRPGRYFDQVAAGRTIDVVRRGERVARIVSA